MRNMIPPASDMNSLVKRQDRRLAILSELLGYDRQRLAGWSFAQEVLSAWWEYEDHGTLDPKWLKTASSLEALL
jgi:streptomycin 6-kinase